MTGPGESFDGWSRSVVFTGAHQVEVRQERVSAPGPKQLLVRTRCSLVSIGTELICLERNFEPGSHWDRWVQYPFTPGYSNIGEVVEAGEEVDGFQEGDRVATRGGHREFFLTDASRAVPVPAAVTDEEAAWFALAGITQNGVRAAAHELGDAVVVIGLGPLGQLVTQYAALIGARAVIAVDTIAGRLEMAAAHGATGWFHGSAEEAREAVNRHTDGRLADVVYDVTGHAAVFPAALGLARKFGKVVLLGDTGRPSEQRLTPDVITRGLRIIGAHDTHAPAAATDHHWWTNANMQRLFFGYVERGRMRVADLITHRFSPREAVEAYGQLSADRSSAVGVVFDWSDAGW